MKNLAVVFWVLSLLFCGDVSAQKKVAELTLQYEAGFLDKSGQTAGPASIQLSYFIKGFLIKSEQVASGFSSSIILDTYKGNTTLLKEVSGQKLMIKLSPEEWAQKNERYKDLVFTYGDASKLINGYKCQQAETQLPGGVLLKVFFTNELEIENKSFDPMFEKLAGLPLEWELKQGENTIRYTLTKIALNPIPVSKFDLPKTGYRELSYEEAKKMKMN